VLVFQVDQEFGCVPLIGWLFSIEKKIVGNLSII